MNWHIERSCDIPHEQNIISKAVSLFREQTGYDKKLNIVVEKHIPLGGGLGGGSSDAASTLLALNRLASPDGKGLLDKTALASIGEKLGSDVPFFLGDFSGTAAAWVSGRGESVRPVVLPEAVSRLSFVVVNPGIHSDTARAFRLLDQHQKAGHCPSRPTVDPAQFLSLPTHEWHFVNDFLSAFSDGDESGAIYRKIIGSLYGLGADFAGLSGSGSSCFGVFSSQSRAKQAKELLLRHWPFVVATFLLAY
jgi:4-diphosphocytidyl-2-C-methyl-D-erythritol kinase